METKFITSEKKYKDFLSYKEAIESKAEYIARKMADINPEVEMAPSLSSIEFWGDAVSVNTYGYCRGEYTESVSFPVSYMWDENWQEKYQEEIKKNKIEKEMKETEEKKKREAEREKKDYETFMELKKRFE